MPPVNAEPLYSISVESTEYVTPVSQISPVFASRFVVLVDISILYAPCVSPVSGSENVHENSGVVSWISAGLVSPSETGLTGALGGLFWLGTVLFGSG